MNYKYNNIVFTIITSIFIVILIALTYWNLEYSSRISYSQIQKNKVKNTTVHLANTSFELSDNFKSYLISEDPRWKEKYFKLIKEEYSFENPNQAQVDSIVQSHFVEFELNDEEVKELQFAAKLIYHLIEYERLGFNYNIINDPNERASDDKEKIQIGRKFVSSQEYESIHESLDESLKILLSKVEARLEKELFQLGRYNKLLLTWLVFVFIIISVSGYLIISYYRNAVNKKINELNKINKKLDTIVEERTIKLEEKISAYHELNQKFKNQNKELVKANNNIEKADKTKRQLLNSLPIGVALTSLDGMIINSNDAYNNITGYTTEKLRRLSYWDITPNKYKKQEEKALKSLIKNGSYGPYDKEYIHRNGNLVPVRLNGKIIEIEGVEYIWSSVENLTYLKEQEKELILSKERIDQNHRLLKAITENFPNSFLSIVEKDMRISFSGGKEFKALNLDPEQFNGMHVKDIFKEKAKFVEDIYRKTFHGEELSFELFLNNQYQAYSTVPLFGDNNKVERILVVTENITNRKKFEIELINAKNKAEESDKLKSEFIGNMSHEIRTPMNGIIGFAALLDNPELSETKRSQYVKIIKNSGNQLLRVIDDILEISQLETKQVKVNWENVNINDLIFNLYSVFNIKAKQNNTPLYHYKALEDDLAILYSDESKINKILSNLLENALKFTDNGIIEFGYRLDKSSIIFFVKDTGCGIAQEDQSNIFKRFSQVDFSFKRNKSGLGLGLSIAKENTELLGGEISLKSELGKGTEFTVKFPFEYQNNKIIENQSKRQGKDNTQAVKEINILIAEDEEINYLYLETLIMDQYGSNINLTHARNGEEAVEFVKNKKFDLVLMDVKMPKKDGFQACKEIIEFNPNLNVYFQSAYTSPIDKEKAKSVGSMGFLEKPINADILIKLIDSILKNYKAPIN